MTAAFIALAMRSAAHGQTAPGSSADLRRCVASVRTLRVLCMSESVDSGFGQLLGFDPNQLKPPIPAGPRMTGDYSAADGFRLIFEPVQVITVCRGVPMPRPYMLTESNTTVIK